MNKKVKNMTFLEWTKLGGYRMGSNMTTNHTAVFFEKPPDTIGREMKNYINLIFQVRTVSVLKMIYDTCNLFLSSHFSVRMLAITSSMESLTDVDSIRAMGTSDECYML